MFKLISIQKGCFIIMDKKLKTVETFDTEFFVIGQAYQIIDTYFHTRMNCLLNDMNDRWLTFYDQDGDSREIGVEEYKEHYDIIKLVPDYPDYSDEKENENNA